MAAWQPGSSASMTPLVRCLLVVLAPWRAMTWEETRSLHSFRATSEEQLETADYAQGRRCLLLDKIARSLQQHTSLRSMLHACFKPG
jgi:hypothetical protein